MQGRQRSARRACFAVVLALLLAAFLVNAASAGDGDHHKRSDKGTQATTTATDSSGADATSTCWN